MCECVYVYVCKGVEYVCVCVCVCESVCVFACVHVCVYIQVYNNSNMLSVTDRYFITKQA